MKLFYPSSKIDESGRGMKKDIHVLNATFIDEKDRESMTKKIKVSLLTN